MDASSVPRAYRSTRWGSGLLFAAMLVFGIVSSPALALEKKKLTPSASAGLRGKTLSVLTHEQRDMALAGKLVAFGDKEGYRSAAEALGLSGTDGLTAIEKDMASSLFVAMPDIQDPAPSMAADLRQRLVDRYGLDTPVELQPTRPLHATSLVGNAISPKKYVPVLLENGNGADFLLDVQTLIWQITRPNRVYGTWFTYFARMSFIDVHNGKVLAQWDCSTIQRFASRELIPLPVYLGDGKAMLKKDLDAARSTCTKDFYEALGLTPGETTPH